MKSSPINNLLSIAAPAPTARGGASGSSKEFDLYMHKAAAPIATTEKSAPKREPEVSPSEPAPESETIEQADQEQASSTPDQDDKKDTTNEQPLTSEKNPTNDDTQDKQDEVVLSDAAVALQFEKTIPKEASAENEELESDTVSSEQKPKQSELKSSLNTTAVETNTDGVQEEGTDFEEAQEAKGESRVSTVQIPESHDAEKPNQPGRNPTNHARESDASTGAGEDSHLQGESKEQSGALQEILLPGEKSKIDSGVTIQKLTPLVGEATDSSTIPSNNNSSAVTSGQNSSNASVVQLVPTADQHRTEASSPPAGSETAVPTVDRGRFVQRVANAFRSAQQNDGEIQLRLSPPELGSLKIEISVRHGVLTAKLEAETVEARNTLLDNLPALRQRLADQDIRIEKFEVDIRREGGQGQSGAEDRQPSDESNRGSMTQRKRMKDDSEVITPRTTRAVTSHSSDSLDVRI
ncbi:flagellar hook-length control protein FliK [Bythopirellula goksoeyrii]|uniref:Flagellar hook-length control protein FliK n=1 Tax=Bythopirellula goksoeyrii TaxID=1400387 RepID=A0A5B9Q5N5_9BACT|nr:flagellar hook-length control protein FliK [Bythopirellula goksoeyrii]QEG33050.1 Flagellar hook-length control protein FliK [Bythopirellula goksoeyrii]